MPPRPILETDRLILRPFELADASEVQRLAGDPAIADTTLNIPHPYGDGIAEGWIATHQQSFDEGKGLTLAVTRKADGALMGAISLMSIAPEHQAELGYWMGKRYWGQGFCTEAARAIIGYAFDQLGLIRVHAIHFSRNPASGRVMQKSGMTHEGQRHWHARKGDELIDIELYGIVKPS